MEPHITVGIHLSRIKTGRAAVIPYTIKMEENECKIYFLLAIDYTTGEVTDFGGGVKQHETTLIACLREFKEESNNIFDPIYSRVNDYTLNLSITDGKMATLFIYLDVEWLDKTEFLFEKSKKYYSSKKRCYNEIANIFWVDAEQFEELLSPKDTRMWLKIKKFYQKNYNKKIPELLLKIT
jgi:hypothetical protein